MPGEVARGGFRLGVLVLLLSAGMLPFLDRSSAEFVVSALAACLALLFLGGLALLLRRSAPAPPPPSRKESEAP